MSRTPRHHAMLTYWQRSALPSDERPSIVVSDDDPSKVEELLVHHLRRWCSGVEAQAEDGEVEPMLWPRP